MGNLVDPILAAARRHADRPALRLADMTTTYAELDDGSARVAGMLRGLGIGPGDRVAVMLPNVPQFALAYYGALRLGAVVVPMNPLLKMREVRYYLADAGATVIFALHGLHEHAEAGAEQAGATCITVPFDLGDSVVSEVEPREDDDTAVLLYTSGTTGSPKGAELTNASLRRNMEISTGLFDVQPEDVSLGVLPLFHSFGQTCTLNAAMSAGACLTLLPRFDPGQALELIEQHRVTICAGVPTMYSAVLAHQRLAETDVSRLRVCISGGSAMPVDVLERCEADLGAPLLEGYGLTETSPVASFNHPDRPHKPGSIGTPIEGVELRLVDDDDRELGVGPVGEIVVRGHNVMKGYWRQPEATATTMRGGWLHTGDLARVDEDGYYFIVDRKKDLIIRGGLNVYPREVEEILHEHPAVREAAVVAVPHELLGQDIGAAIVLEPGAEPDPRALRSYVREQIAAYKYPRHVWFVDELPKGPMEKVLKRHIEVPEAVTAGRR